MPLMSGLRTCKEVSKNPTYLFYRISCLDSSSFRTISATTGLGWILTQTPEGFIFLDSQENSDRRRQVLTVMTRFVAQSVGTLVTTTMQIETTRSGQQVNSYDYGLYTIENARTLVNRWDRPEIIGNAARPDAFNRLYDTVIQNRRWTETEMARRMGPSPGRGSPVLGGSPRTATSTPLSRALSGVTTPSSSRPLTRREGFPLNMAPPCQEPDYGESRWLGRRRGRGK